MQPEQAVFLFQTVQPVLDREHQLTKRIFEAIPLDKGDYRPDAVSKTALELGWHIALTENRFLDGVAAGEINFSGPARPETAHNSADLAAWYEENFSRNIERIRQLSGEALAKMLDFRGMFQMAAVELLNFSLRHAIHHRGQLSTYLRPMGAKVPSIYGESYDSAQARKAAQG
jgi:uncharacterized damage-inducible protein DinB